MKSNHYTRQAGTQHGVSNAGHSGMHAETVPNIGPMAKDLTFIHDKLEKRRRRAIFYDLTQNDGRVTDARCSRARRRGQKLSTEQNVKEKPFGLKDLKTGEINGRKEMTASKATALNKTLEPLGLFWINIPY